MKKGFTLAEVLITLGIIGVVAAMTMPALIQKHRKQVVETRLAKFYSVINQAVQQSEVNNGPKEFWDKNIGGFDKDSEGNIDEKKHTTLDWYNKYLGPYLKTTKVEVSKTSGKVMAYFADGSLCLMSSSSYLFWPNAKDFVEYEHTETGTVSKNLISLSGIKYFTFYFNPSTKNSMAKYHHKKGVEPYKYNWNGTMNMLWNNSSIGCNQNTTDERAYCTALIQMNGWKIPDNYPFKF